jgi:hypothetical protein
MAAHMMNSGKNGVSAHEIHRSIGVTYKTAWFMMHRLREAMTDIKPGLGVSDGERTANALKGIEGKRLTYRSTNENRP